MAAASAATPEPIVYGQYTVPHFSEMVNFSVGQPASTMLPLDKIRQAAAKKFAETDVTFLQYGVVSGYEVFRKSLAAFLAKHYKRDVDPERLFATNGVTGGLTLLCSLFTTAGDSVVVEAPSYFLALNIFKELGLKVKEVGIDEEGMDVDALEALCKAGEAPRVVYTVPTFHNPTGYTMSPARREKLVALAEEYGFVVFADEVYQLLGFADTPEPPPSLCTYDKSEKGCVVSLGSFSKILAPALRMGWYEAHPALLARVAESGQLDSSGGINPVISGIVQVALDDGLQEEHLKAVKAELGARAKKLSSELEKQLPEGCSFAPIGGGYFVWIKLPEGVEGAPLLAHAAHSHKVRFLPGTKFGGPQLSGRIRLSISFYPPEGIEVGVARLAEAIRTFVANGCKPVAGDEALKAVAGTR
ncbi:hypothetical protein FNF27_01849 [Cafeteria roenbergensis]|uniref:Aminotransferase class I/classII large domain-containing protein n=2 Tax=Cafeteria roenbergensis TaxID=33653 RepID=A0A5A8EH67_CAFRO|nr:hypothetical protein FNF27_01849 [Cafeteria roenbergensis]